MFDLVQRQVKLVGMALGAAELAAIVGQHRTDRQIELAIERQHVIVQHRNGRLRLLGDVQEAEGVAAERIDHGVQIDLADALQIANEERVLAEQLARTAAFHVPLAEARVLLLEEVDLLLREFDRLLGIAPFQRQPALFAQAEIVIVEDLLDRDRRDPGALQHQQRLDAIAAIGWVLHRQRQDALHHFVGRRLRVRSVDRRQVFQAIETVRLKPPLPLIEAGAVHAAPPARLRRIAQPRRQIQHRQALLCHLRLGIHRSSPHAPL